MRSLGKTWRKTGEDRGRQRKTWTTEEDMQEDMHRKTWTGHRFTTEPVLPSPVRSSSSWPLSPALSPAVMPATVVA